MDNIKNERSGIRNSGSRVAAVGLLIGFLLNLTGWLGNNLVLKPMWQEVSSAIPDAAWRQSIWRHVFSFIPDFLYGFAIAWLLAKLKPDKQSYLPTAFSVGVFVSLVGGITTYFAIANSGFIPWKLALISFALVLFTKIPLAILGGKMLSR